MKAPKFIVVAAAAAAASFAAAFPIAAFLNRGNTQPQPAAADHAAVAVMNEVKAPVTTVTAGKTWKSTVTTLKMPAGTRFTARYNWYFL